MTPEQARAQADQLIAEIRDHLPVLQDLTERADTFVYAVSESRGPEADSVDFEMPDDDPALDVLAAVSALDELVSRVSAGQPTPVIEEQWRRIGIPLEVKRL